MSEIKDKATRMLKEAHQNVHTGNLIYVLIALTHAVLAVQEELERMNNQELKIEELDWHKLIRKIDR